MRFRRLAALCLALSAPVLLLSAQQPATADIQVQLADLLMNEARFRDAVEAYRRAVAAAAEEGLRRKAQSGLVLALLRTGDFAAARAEAQRLTEGTNADALSSALLGDTLWA